MKKKLKEAKDRNTIEADLLTYSNSTGEISDKQKVGVRFCWSNEPPIFEIIVKTGKYKITAVHIPAKELGKMMYNRNLHGH